MDAISRRRFLTTTAGAGLAGILAARVPPARGTSFRLIVRVSHVSMG